MECGCGQMGITTVDKPPVPFTLWPQSNFNEEYLFMADIERKAQAQWTGDLMGGSGKTSTGSGFLNDVSYSVPSRFDNAKGTNPEELLAAAHASCFSMMMAKVLGDEKKTANTISTKATLTMA